jgi:hypothetical protein
MLNKLDGKCIVDRVALAELLRLIDQNFPDYEYTTSYGPRIEPCRKALATELTGWAAVPVLSTIQMDVDGSNEMLGDEFAGLDSDVAAKVWNAMLNVSPPLPGGGE